MVAMGTSQEALALRLRQAYTEGAVSPLRDGLSPNDADGAYHIQSINTLHWIDQGRRVVGHKIGLTAKAVQQQFGVDQPDFGVLFDDMAVVDGGILEASCVLQPRVEAEIALVLGRDLDSEVISADDVMAATDYAIAAIEIVDSRIADWQISFADTVADNGSSAFFVLGSQKRTLEDLDLYTCGMVLEISEEIVSLGAGAACMGHPLNAAAWLAETLVRRGEGLKAGEVVLTGALGPMVTLKPGDRVCAKIGGVGSCSFTFAKDRS